MDPEIDPGLEFDLRISEAGSYQLFARAASFDGDSDSMYVSIVEKGDGASGGEADWYRIQPAGATFQWYGNGEIDGTSGSGSPDPMVWDLAAGEYTLRFMPREDGVALDAWALVNTAVNAGAVPSGTQTGPAHTSNQGTVTITVKGRDDAGSGSNDTVTVDEDTAQGVNVLGNDTDPDATDTLAVDSLDTSGTIGVVTITDSETLIGADTFDGSSGINSHFDESDDPNDFAWSSNDGGANSFHTAGLGEGSTGNALQVSTNGTFREIYTNLGTQTLAVGESLAVDFDARLIGTPENDDSGFRFGFYASNSTNVANTGYFVEVGTGSNSNADVRKDTSSNGAFLSGSTQLLEDSTGVSIGTSYQHLRLEVTRTGADEMTISLYNDGVLVASGIDTSGINNGFGTFGIANGNTSNDYAIDNVKITRAGNDVTYDPNGQFEYLAAGETATDSFAYYLENQDGTVYNGDGTTSPSVSVNFNDFALGDIDGLSPGFSNNTGGDGFASGSEWLGTGTMDIVAGDLTYPGYNDGQMGSGQKLQGTFNELRKLERALETPMSGDVWFSFLVQPVDGNAYAGIAFNQQGSSTTFASGSPTVLSHGSDLIVRTNGTTDVVTPDIFTVGETSLVIGRLSMGGGPDTLTLWVDPDFSNTSAIPAPTFTTSADYGSQVTNLALASYHVGGTAGGYLDNVLLSDNPYDVIGVTPSTVDVTISGVNDAPVITSVATGESTDEGTPISVTGLATFTDLDLTDFAASATEDWSITVDWGDGTAPEVFDKNTGMSNLALVLDSAGAPPSTPNTWRVDGTHLYADDDADDTYTVTITIDDGNGGVDQATTTIGVLNVDPAANADSYATDEDTQFSSMMHLLNNDTDPGNPDPLTVTGIQGGVSLSGLSDLGATIQITDASTGAFTYDPRNAAALQALAEGETIQDTFTYSIEDGDGGTATGIVTIDITGRGDIEIDLTLDFPPPFGGNPGDDAALDTIDVGLDASGNLEIVVNGVLLHENPASALGNANSPHNIVLVGSGDDEVLNVGSLGNNVFNNFMTDTVGGMDSVNFTEDSTLVGGIVVDAEAIDLGASLTTGAGQDFNGPVTLSGGNGVTLTSNGGGTIDFSSTVDGNEVLAVNTAGATNFNGAVGSMTPLAGLSTDGAGTLAIHGGSVTTNGSQSFGEALQLSGNTTFTNNSAAGDIGFANTVDGGFDLVVNSAGTATFGGALGGTAPLASLDVDTGGALSFDVTVETSGNLDATSDTSVTVNQTLMSGDNVSLTVTDSAAFDTENINVNADVTAQNSIAISAGDNVSVNIAAMLTFGDDSTIDIDPAGSDADLGEGGTLTFLGTANNGGTGSTLTINGGDDPDAFTVNPSGNTEITVNGGAPFVPVSNLPDPTGDTLSVLFNNVTGIVKTPFGVSPDGTISFDDPHQDINFTSIEAIGGATAPDISNVDPGFVYEGQPIFPNIEFTDPDVGDFWVVTIQLTGESLWDGTNPFGFIDQLIVDENLVAPNVPLVENRGYDPFTGTLTLASTDLDALEEAVRTVFLDGAFRDQFVNRVFDVVITLTDLNGANDTDSRFAVVPRKNAEIPVTDPGALGAGGAGTTSGLQVAFTAPPGETTLPGAAANPAGAAAAVNALNQFFIEQFTDLFGADAALAFLRVQLENFSEDGAASYLAFNITSPDNQIASGRFTLGGGIRGDFTLVNFMVAGTEMTVFDLYQAYLFPQFGDFYANADENDDLPPVNQF